jgi:hypothetical protein
VFVFLSEKHLKSDFCMTELTRIDCRMDGREFNHRARVFALSDAKYKIIDDALELADY